MSDDMKMTAMLQLLSDQVDYITNSEAVYLAQQNKCLSGNDSGSLSTEELIRQNKEVGEITNQILSRMRQINDLLETQGIVEMNILEDALGEFDYLRMRYQILRNKRSHPDSSSL